MDSVFRLFRSTFRKSLDYFGFYDGIVAIKRYLEKYILKDLEKKIVLLTGPRQTEKTTVAKMKLSDENVNPNFKIFKKFFPELRMVQIVKELKREKTFSNGVEIRSAHRWLSKLSL